MAYLGDAEAVRTRTGACAALAVAVPLLAVSLWRLVSTWSGQGQLHPSWFWLVFGSGLVIFAATATMIDAGTVDFPAAVRAREPLLEQLAALLEGGRVERRGEREVVAGLLDGRAVRVSVWLDPTRLPDVDQVTYEVELTCPWRASVWRAVGAAGRPTPAHGLRVQGLHPPPLDDDELTSLLVRGLDDLRLREVGFEQDGLTARMPANVDLLGAEHQRAVLAHLASLARRVAPWVEPRAEPLDAPPRASSPVDLCVVARPSDTRCPYCRTAFASDAEAAATELAACDACGTVYHDGCWTEHGGCSMPGCQRRVDQRVRER